MEKSYSRIFQGKELLCHAHVQCFAETPGACNQGDAVTVFPPFLYEICFVNIETILLYEVAEILCIADVSENTMRNRFLKMAKSFLNRRRLFCIITQDGI